MSALAALLGAGTGLGLVLVVAGLRTRPSRPMLPRPLDAKGRERLVGRTAVAVGAAVVVGALTGWPVAALLAGAGAFALPGMLGGARERAARVARIEAVASWAEMLRDTLAGAAGLEQAIRATAPLAPAPIAAEVTALGERLGRERLAPSLRAFAAELGDPVGDLVVAALVLSSTSEARRLGDLLSSLAAAAREQASMRLRIEAGRARVRTSARVVMGVTAAMALGLVVLNRPYLAPYSSVAGELVLALVGGLFVAGFWWLARMSRSVEPERFLGTQPEATR